MSFSLKLRSSLLASLAGLILALGTGISSAEPTRPPAVPASAFWLGGPDGGVFVHLKLVTAPGVYTGSIYHPNGALWYRGRFLLRPAGGKAIDPADIHQFSFWDGSQLVLEDGRTLLARPARRR